MKQLIFSASIAILVVLASCSKNNNDVNSTDQTFTMSASLSNTVEVNAGTLAATKATNARVKSFAQFMVMEHQMAQTDLKNMGTSAGITVRDTVDPAHAAIMSQLNSMPAGRAFDSMYIYSQVADHDMTIANFQTELTSGNQSDVKNYAGIYLPHIQMHRAMADSISTAYFKR